MAVVVLTNGTVVTVTGKTFKKGSVVVKDGKIAEVGDIKSFPKEAKIIDVKGGWITPGLIDCHTHISVSPAQNTMPATTDSNEMSDPVTPHVRAIDGLYPRDEAIEIVRNAGFTTCYTTPGSANVIGGTGISFKLRGNTAEEMSITGSEEMKFALGENPKRVYGANGKMPVTRMGTAALIRETLFKAKNYAEKYAKFEKGEGDKPEFDIKLHSLMDVVNGKMRCRIHCHRADDIMTAVRIAKEFGLDFTLEHATEGYLVAEELSKAKVTCIVGPLLLTHLKREVWGLRQDTPAKLHAAGVTVCLTADAGTDTQFLPTHTGIIMREGLPEKAAFESVTINAARVLKLEHRVGSLEPGKDADIAVFNGHPFSNMTTCVFTMIDGEIYQNKLQ